MFARRFNDAGFAVLAFDYRRLGESGGQPRVVLPIRDMLDDWQAAIDFARTLPDIDPAQIAIWGFSASGGHIFSVAARNPGLAAAIAQTPLVDAPAVMPQVLRYSTPLAQLRLTGRALLDALGGLLGRKPLLVPLTGERGRVALLSTPDAPDGDGGGSLRTRPRPLPPRPLRRVDPLPTARRRLRRRPRSTGATGDPSGRARPQRRAGATPRRSLRPVHGRPRTRLQVRAVVSRAARERPSPPYSRKPADDRRPHPARDGQCRPRRRPLRDRRRCEQLHRRPRRGDRPVSVRG
jgi:Serine aminopeptidase, S33